MLFPAPWWTEPQRVEGQVPSEDSNLPQLVFALQLVLRSSGDRKVERSNLQTSIQFEKVGGCVYRNKPVLGDLEHHREFTHSRPGHAKALPAPAAKKIHRKTTYKCCDDF